MSDRTWSPATTAVTAGRPEHRPDAPLNAPITMASTYVATGDLEYGRYGNPTWSAFEEALGALEGGRCLAFASGLATVSTVLDLVGQGAAVVAPRHAYNGTVMQLADLEARGRLTARLVDITDTEAVVQACDDAALVWVESPTNPALELAEIETIAAAAHDAGAYVVVDNTFATPARQCPIELGADVVLHSTTKFLGGHSDVIGGALVARDRKVGERLRWLQNAVGAVPSPVDSFLVLRGLHTLAVRMDAHEASARAVAEVAAADRRVAAVHYPGLRSHPQYALGRRQTTGPGGIVTVDLRGGGRAARKFLRGLRIFTLAESLGGVESLVDHPASMTHASVPRAEREAHGVTDGIVRLSCGIEDPADLADDVRGALGRV